MLTDLDQKLSAIRRGELDEQTVYARSFAERRQLMPAEGPVFFCPICATWHRRFLSFGLGGRKNAKCPTCGSLERHRYLWRHLRDRLHVERRKRDILHVAPEPCIAARLSTLANVRYLTMDLYNEGAALNRDLTDTGLPSGTFDMVICSHVLEHIERDDLAIAEMARVLRPGGRLVVMVPVDRKLAVTYEDASITDPVARHAAFGHPYHVRVCGMDYPDRIRAAGFEVTVFDSKRMSPLTRHVERINKTLLFDGCKRRD